MNLFAPKLAAVWTSDIGPHWRPQSFVDWPGLGEALDEPARLGDGAIAPQFGSLSFTIRPLRGA